MIEGDVIIAFDQHVFQSSVAMATPSRFADLSRQEIAGLVEVYTTLEYNPTIYREGNSKDSKPHDVISFGHPLLGPPLNVEVGRDFPIEFLV